jgi:hypothetical protein
LDLDAGGDGVTTCGGDIYDFDPAVADGGYLSKVGLSMILIETGDFVMCCMAGETECIDHELPTREVEITRDHVDRNIGPRVVRAIQRY